MRELFACLFRWFCNDCSTMELRDAFQDLYDDAIDFFDPLESNQ